MIRPISTLSTEPSDERTHRRESFPDVIGAAFAVALIVWLGWTRLVAHETLRMRGYGRGLTVVSTKRRSGGLGPTKSQMLRTTVFATWSPIR